MYTYSSVVIHLKCMNRFHLNRFGFVGIVDDEEGMKRLP